MKNENEVDAARAKIFENEASKYPGMTYEQGLAEALDWIVSQEDSALYE